jgi:hemin uptake protein HemP
MQPDPVEKEKPIASRTVQVIEAAAPKRISSKVLLSSRRELLIEHDGREYRLRVTQNGKLILTA